MSSESDKGDKHESPMPGQLYAGVKRWHSSRRDDGSPDSVITTDIEKANVITSMIADKVTHHKLIIDLDMPAKLIPSTTEGHFHLYIDHEIEWDKYQAVLDAMADAGLVEPGYVSASKARAYTAVRLPWIKKQPEGRALGHHEWAAGVLDCVCGHPVSAHRSEIDERDPSDTVIMVCTVADCDDPEAFEFD